ncbi:hypothetical protein [Actinoplanes sp. L3-i22]|uniref:hypothetical protein n=1 Tax=Actinoplanes sp. L3-i22 TaxID=2836373 RepID=UPI001C73F178|nr:hypothetical protein [Actinoplanes sp. L3-i22]BCY13650.1 hypothetical protein L3i22_087380 [Actinoplanes sp. L3-i22]
MTGGDIQPDSPFLVVGLFLDRLSDDEALAKTCRALHDLGASYTGSAWAGPAEPPPFEYVTDLPLRLSDWPVTAPGERQYRVGMSIEDLGTLAVSFGRADPAGGHPVAVMTFLGPYSYPDYWDDEDRAEAVRYRARALAVLRGLCDGLDPLYASVEEEEAVPVPSRLARVETMTPPDFYLADRARSRMGPIPDLFPEAVVEEWRTGVFVSHWLAPAEPVEPPPGAWGTVSRELGRAAAELGWVERRPEH